MHLLEFNLSLTVKLMYINVTIRQRLSFFEHFLTSQIIRVVGLCVYSKYGNRMRANSNAIYGYGYHNIVCVCVCVCVNGTQAIQFTQVLWCMVYALITQ